MIVDARAAARKTRLSVPRLLRENGVFRRYWGAHTVSLFGDQITLLAIPLIAVLTLDASAAQMGYLTAVALAPVLLFALHAGAWVDSRGQRRRAMIACDLGRAALLVSVPIAYLFDALTFPQLYAVAFGAGALSVLFNVADASLFQTIVPRERFVDASALLNGSRAFSFVAGPTVAGFLVRVVTGPGALVVDALSFLCSGALLGRIHPEEPAADAEQGGITFGLRWIAGSPLIRAALLATATINFFNFVFWSLFVLYATRTLGVSAGTLGLVLGAGAVGGLVGSVAATPVSRRIGIGPTLVVGCVVFAAPFLLVPLAAGPDPVVLGCLFLAELGSGFGVMLLDISAGAIMAAVIPIRLRSRISGAYTFVNYGVRVVGALLGGLLGSTIGLRPTLWIGAAGALLGALMLLPTPIARLRELPEPDASQSRGRCVPSAQPRSPGWRMRTSGHGPGTRPTRSSGSRARPRAMSSTSAPEPASSRARSPRSVTTSWRWSRSPRCSTGCVRPSPLRPPSSAQRSRCRCPMHRSTSSRARRRSTGSIPGRRSPRWPACSGPEGGLRSSGTCATSASRGSTR